MMKADKLWGFAFFATAMVPVMLIISRTGMEITTALVSLSFLAHCIRRREWQWLRTPFSLACLVAWLWLLLVVSPLGVDPKSSFANAIVWFRFPLLFAALNYWVLARREALTAFAICAASVLFLTMLDTIVQGITGMSLSGHAALASGRLTGPFEAPKVGIFLAKLLLPVAAILLVYGPKKHHAGAIAGVVLALLGLLTIILSGERSAFVTTMLGGGVALLLLMLREKRFRVPCIAIGVVAVLLAGGLYVASPKVQKRAGQMYDTMRHYPQSDYGVLMLAAIDMGLDHPIHGVGMRGFKIVCPELTYWGGNFRGLHPHNAYAEWLSEAGFVGLGLFIAMLVLLIRRAWQGFAAVTGLERLIPAMALGLMAQHFFPLIGSQSFFVNWSGTLLWFSLSVMFAALPRGKTLQ